MTDPGITRSPGIPISPIGGHIVGGGYTGATDKLDQTVEQAAEALNKAYDMPVTIRFNSDRQSGGAWLKTHKEDRIGANTEIGITASLISKRQIEAIREYDGDEVADSLVEGDVSLFILISDTSLKDRSLRKHEDWQPRMVRGKVGYVETPVDGYLRRKVESIEEAVRFLEENALPFANLEQATKEAEALKTELEASSLDPSWDAGQKWEHNNPSLFI